MITRGNIKHDYKKEAEAHIRNVNTRSNFITELGRSVDPNRGGRQDFVDELVNALWALNGRINELEAEIKELKG